MRKHIFLYLIVICIISFVTYSYAAVTISSSNVSYDNTTGLESTNVQDAIDEIYNSCKKKIPSDVEPGLESYVTENDKLLYIYQNTVAHGYGNSNTGLGTKNYFLVDTINFTEDGVEDFTGVTYALSDTRTDISSSNVGYSGGGSSRISKLIQKFVPAGTLYKSEFISVSTSAGKTFDVGFDYKYLIVLTGMGSSAANIYGTYMYVYDEDVSTTGFKVYTQNNIGANNTLPQSTSTANKLAEVTDTGFTLSKQSTAYARYWAIG